VVAAETALHRWLKAYGSIRRFLCPSEFLRSKMIEANVFPDRMHAIPNFAPVETIPLKASPGGDVIYIGRLSPEKGVDTLIRAAALGRFAVRIVGDGPERRALESLSSDVGAAATFEGHLGKERLLELLRSSSVSVLPARWYENQPISIIESFSAGVPVVATDLGGLPELIQPGETGALVPVDDPQSLAAALRSYVDEPDMGLRQGRTARAFAEREFTPKVHLARMRRVYEQAIAG
jgi:glycosyltransferase involved in cell wall biosynthesis